MNRVQRYKFLCLHQGGHKPGKHGKPGKLREFEKLSNFQRKLREILYFYGKSWKTQGKPGWPQTWKTQGIGKIVKISGKSQGNLNFMGKNLENSGKCRIYGIITNGNVFQRIILFGISQGKV